MWKLIFSMFFIFVGNCLKAQPPENFPPEQVIVTGIYRDSIINELIILCDYEALFDSIRDNRMNILSKEYGWSSEQISKIRQNVKFSDFDKWHFYSGYSEYSDEELQSILEYFKGITETELSNSKVKYEEVILLNIIGNNGGNMDARIRKAAQKVLKVD